MSAGKPGVSLWNGNFPEFLFREPDVSRRLFDPCSHEAFFMLLECL